MKSVPLVYEYMRVCAGEREREKVKEGACLGDWYSEAEGQRMSMCDFVCVSLIFQAVVAKSGSEWDAGFR